MLPISRFLVALLFILPFGVEGQIVCTPESRAKLDTTLIRLSKMDLANHSIGELAVEIGSWFIQTPYVEKTLELPGKEYLVVNLMGLDCTTFVETVVALTRIANRDDFTVKSYEKELEGIRYQQGQRGEYPSRLHYFSDWIFQNQQKGILTDITKVIGGKPYENAPSFMSSNPKYYSQLSNPDYVSQLRETEAAIGSRTYYYIPKDEISKHESNIQSGDLIAITTSIPNLDIVHVGFAIVREGRIHLLHASTSSMKVEVSQKPLSDYIDGKKSQSGIIVSRLIGND